MLILDFSSVIIANLHAQVGIHNMREVEEDLLRHMILNTIRSINVKFRKYGDMVIACDRGSWRKSVYPYYKANRAKAKEKTGLDWRQVFEIFTKIRNELKESFPYRVIEVEGAEADDVISTLVEEFGNDLPIGNAEEIVILSPDKDFAQLHRYSNVKQFDPIKKRWIEVPDPNEFLLEHVIKGDSGDGVPNILSDDDTFVVPEKRQKTMTAKRLAEAKASYSLKFEGDKVTAVVDPKFLRNWKLIDLRFTPGSLREEIMAEYHKQAGKDRSKIFNYLMTHRLRNLIEATGEF